MSVLAQFGVDAAQVASLNPAGQSYPKVVPGRVAHIDADFMAYQVSAESKAELDPDDPTPRKHFGQMLDNAQDAVEYIRRMAGAERAVLHTTHNSNKGGRADQAMLKPYQANREDRTNKPEYLDAIREFLGSGVGDKTGVYIGMNHTEQEADDGMTQAAYADFKNAIVCSADKDLNMVPGWKLDMNTYQISYQEDHFGFIEIDASKSSKKVVGRGTKFFWAQCLMGDTADNISGLPECPGEIWQMYSGTAAFRETWNQFTHAKDGLVKDRLKKKLVDMTGKTKKCGPVLTYDLLKEAKTDKDCFGIVKQCYEKLMLSHGYEFKNYRTQEPISPTQALLSEMRLLWMRRTPDPDDVLKWLKEVMK